MYLNRKDYFFITSKRNKTAQLATRILDSIGIEVTDANIKAILYKLRPAKCCVKTMSNGKQYYDISGENFGGYGSFVDDGDTIIIDLR